MKQPSIVKPKLNQVARIVNSNIFGSEIAGKDWHSVANSIIKQTEALIASEVNKAVELATAKRQHLKKNHAQSFCGWGTESGAEFVEIIEDATCKSCIRLAELEGKT